MAATVNRPRGGKFACLERNLKVCLKLQRVSGYCGQIRSTFKLLFSRCGLSMIMSVGIYFISYLRLPNITQANKLVRKPRHPVEVIPAIKNPF